MLRFTSHRFIYSENRKKKKKKNQRYNFDPFVIINFKKLRNL